MHEPLVSVVIPTFNRNGQLRDAVDSVLAQNYRNLELIVVDDCSKVPAAVSLADVHDPRLRIIRHVHNGGVSVARNTGAAAAEGDLLAFLDDDDRWKPHKLDWQLAYMEAGKEKFQASVTNFATESDQALYNRCNSKMDPAWLILTGCAMTMGSSMLVPREVFKDVGGFDPNLRCAEDWDWLLRYYEHHHQMAVAPEALTIYRGDHRSNTQAVASAISYIQSKHHSALAGQDYHAFDAAIMWKRARNKVTEKRYGMAAVQLASVAVRHPVNFSRYVQLLLREPVRHFVYSHTHPFTHKRSYQEATPLSGAPAIHGPN